MNAGLFQRLPRALHALDRVPTGRGWNHPQVDDLFPAASQRIEAAVLVGLIERAGVITVLLTERSAHLSQHPGQVSFPGGRIEADDRDPVAAALREAEEEVGIGGDWIEPIGFLDPLETISNYRVLPVVARLRAGFAVVAGSSEVAAVFEVPLAHFLDPLAAQRSSIEYRGRQREIFAFDCAGHRVWGATAAMLINLRQRLESLQ